MSIGDIRESLEQELESSGNDLDYISLFEGWATITRVFNILLGILVGVLIISIPLIVALETCYLLLPRVSEVVDRVSVRPSGHEVKVLTFIFRDAKRAKEEAVKMNGQGLSNPLFIYLRRKIWVIFFASILVALVLSGGQLIPDVVKQIFSGLIDFFS